MPGLVASTWTLKYIYNKSFPTAVYIANNSTLRSKIINNKNKVLVREVISKNPGKMNNLSSNNKKRMNSTTFVQGLFKNTNNNKKVSLVVKGIAGLGVDKLGQSVKSAGLADAASAKILRSLYIELKRNGDYFQVYSCHEVNKNNDVYIIKPGDSTIASHTGEERVNDLKKISPVDKFYFEKCCY